MFYMILWIVCGTYGMAANIERVKRLYPNLENDPVHGLQNFLTVLLGPIGIVIVVAHDGRLLFWKRRER